MPVYSPIRRWMDGAEKARTAERLLALRQKLSSEITDRVGRNLDALDLLMSILGESWDYFATSAIEVCAGREERIAFLFRQDKIRFRKIAGEVALPGGQMTAPRDLDGEAREGQPLRFVRAPFMAAFEAGTVRLNFCLLHLHHQRGTKSSLPRLATELEALARFFREKQDREREDYILIGDFGAAVPADLVAKTLERHGFDIPEALTRKRAHLDGEKFYDQIAFRPSKDRLEPGNAGTFRHFDAVFRDNDDDFAAYQELMPEDKANDLWNGGPRGYYAQQWRTWQISDHQLLWVELKVDFSDHYLDSIRKGAG